VSQNPRYASKDLPPYRRTIKQGRLETQVLEYCNHISLGWDSTTLGTRSKLVRQMMVEDASRFLFGTAPAHTGKVAAIQVRQTSRAQSVTHHIQRCPVILCSNVNLIPICFHRSVLNMLRLMCAKGFEPKRRIGGVVIETQAKLGWRVTSRVTPISRKNYSIWETSPSIRV
jgi:hypothetical protein